MVKGCLSVVDDCKILCPVCEYSNVQFVEQETKKQIDAAIRVLKYHGYTVTAPAEPQEEGFVPDEQIWSPGGGSFTTQQTKQQKPYDGDFLGDHAGYLNQSTPAPEPQAMRVPKNGFPIEAAVDDLVERLLYYPPTTSKHVDYQERWLIGLPLHPPTQRKPTRWWPLPAPPSDGGKE